MILSSSNNNDDERQTQGTPDRNKAGGRARQTDRQAGKQVGRQAGRQASRQTGRQADKERQRRCVKVRVQELCESRGGRPGLSVLLILTPVSVDVKQH